MQHLNLLWKYLFLLHTCKYLHEISAKVFNSDNLPAIIWWSNLLFPHVGKTKEIQCTLGKCISSAKRNYQSDVPAAYIFYGTDFEGTDLPLPRRANHLWVLLHEESPMNNYIFSHLSGIRIFNLSGTFSRNSDFPLTTQHLPSLEYLTLRKPLSIHIKNEYRKNGTAPVMYLQSHCNVASYRDEYVKNLMEYIDVDALGACLHNKDLPMHLSSTDMHNDGKLFDFISRYKFHLAFENAICNDYITEKFFRSLHVGSVPVYKGSPSIKDWMPDEMSAILVDDFESPESLAAFLLELDKNDQLYEKYLLYKQGITNDFLKFQMAERTWGVNDPDKLDFIQSLECFVCNKLQKSDVFSSTNKADKSHMNCSQPHTFLSLNTKNLRKDKWLEEDWVENYWFSLDQARAIELMIKNNENNTANFWKYISAYKYNN